MVSVWDMMVIEYWNVYIGRDQGWGRSWFGCEYVVYCLKGSWGVNIIGSWDVYVLGFNRLEVGGLNV